MINSSLIEKITSSLGVENLISMTIISIAIILMVGFLATRITKKLKLPNVTAYIIVGVLLVPIWKVMPNDIDGIIPSNIINGMSFLSDIALAFIAFSAGEFFKLEILKKTGKNVIIITIFEAMFAIILVFILCYFALGISIEFSLVLAALASATAPASTIMTIKQTKAKGPFVNTLLEVVALDDVVSLIAYSIAISIALVIKNGNGASFSNIGLPIIKNIVCLGIGFIFGFLLKFMLPKKRTTDNRLIILIAFIFSFCGICSLLDQSPLLGCMAMGMVYINVSDDDKLFKQLNYFSPPILLCFFVMSGMKFNLNAFTNFTMIGYVPLFVVALVYFIARLIGKYIGSYTGAHITKSDPSIKKYLGLGLAPQAGVAIGLAYMGARILGDAPGELGDSLQTIILASSVLYELVGPGLAKLSLYLSKSYSNDLDILVPKEEISGYKELSDVDLLKAQIELIRKDIDTSFINEAEDAFDEAAEDYYNENHFNNRFINTKR